MKFLNFYIFLFITTMSSCVFTITENGVIGDGNVKEEEREVRPFHEINVGNGIDVYLSQGNTESLLLIADYNLHDIILTEVNNGILYIKSKENIRKATSLKIELNYKYLDGIKISSAGDVIGKTKLVTDDIEIRLSSAGDLELELEAERIDCRISSSGDANLSGTTKFFYADLSSAGDLDAFNLIAEECKVRVSSAGKAKVFATGLLDLEASSAGDIYYKGEGKVENLKTSSAGTIKKLN